MGTKYVIHEVSQRSQLTANDHQLVGFALSGNEMKW